MAEREHEVKMEQMRWEREREQLRNKEEELENKENKKGTHTGGKFTRYPKLPYFREDTDDMDAYLFRFESHAHSLKWELEEWSRCLGAHLQGGALTLYHSLCAKGMVEYEVLKKALLTKYQCTKDGYKDKFRACKPETDESFLSYSTRFQHLFDRWIDMAETEKTYEGLRDLLFCEHILYSVSKDLAVFLRERNLKTSVKLLDAAENYRLAHPNKSCAGRKI
jgi:hypothetical protein